MAKIFGKKLPENVKIITVEQDDSGKYVLKLFSNPANILFEKRLKLRKKATIHGKPCYTFEVEET